MARKFKDPRRGYLPAERYSSRLIDDEKDDFLGELVEDIKEDRSGNVYVTINCQNLTFNSQKNVWADSPLMAEPQSLGITFWDIVEGFFGAIGLLLWLFISGLILWFFWVWL